MSLKVHEIPDSPVLKAKSLNALYKWGCPSYRVFSGPMFPRPIALKKVVAWYLEPSTFRTLWTSVIRPCARMMLMVIISVTRHNGGDISIFYTYGMVLKVSFSSVRPQKLLIGCSEDVRSSAVVNVAASKHLYVIKAGACDWRRETGGVRSYPHTNRRSGGGCVPGQAT